QSDTICVVDANKCTACQICVKQAGCPAFVLTEETNKGRKKPAIQADSCVGCGVCGQICPSGAISEVKKNG
ncbi:MAG: 4Fe-4S dicluster domain-containing protein, partial [Clostridiales bacterium]